VEVALGNGKKEFGDAEKAVAAKLRYW
jgi:hypothetical protein